ncbi:MAG TPA: diaminobutyrate--2-oxoglutarate transaminase [bacterium]|nr:diaminobutyrate--2-oxoglutarate transaminase [bacterium]
MDTFERLESEVRSYIRSFPTVFTQARGYRLYDEDGREYLDFFAGAGALNYGHNPPELKKRVLQYLADDGIVHSLDMGTAAKREFLERFSEVILQPRKLDYKVMFPGPTGTNSVEAALKLARKVTGRESVVGFTNAFHGMTLGALSVTGNAFKREGAGVPLAHGVSIPYDGYLGDDQDSLDYFEAFLQDKGSGMDTPAAVIVETVQGEGGLNSASPAWLQRLAGICREHEILFIVDDIQAGCGRTGTFFSFEPAGIVPDLVCLSKSIGGIGLPMALTLIRPELDQWAPGEHNGTFRGNNLAFVAATEALRRWEDDALGRHVRERADQLTERLERIVAGNPGLKGHVRGRGLLQGIALEEPALAGKITRAAFERGLIMETSGPEGEVLKVMPPLIIDAEGLDDGLDRFEAAIAACLATSGETAKRKIA